MPRVIQYFCVPAFVVGCVPNTAESGVVCGWSDGQSADVLRSRPRYCDIASYLCQLFDQFYWLPRSTWRVFSESRDVLFPSRVASYSGLSRECRVSTIPCGGLVLEL